MKSVQSASHKISLVAVAKNINTAWHTTQRDLRIIVIRILKIISFKARW